MRSSLRQWMSRVRQHAWFGGLMVLSIAILVIEAPSGADEPEALSVRPYAESPASVIDAQTQRPPARAAQADKALTQRPTIRT
jgi:hypothetical protein